MSVKVYNGAVLNNIACNNKIGEVKYEISGRDKQFDNSGITIDENNNVILETDEIAKIILVNNSEDVSNGSFCDENIDNIQTLNYYMDPYKVSGESVEKLRELIFKKYQAY